MCIRDRFYYDTPGNEFVYHNHPTKTFTFTNNLWYSTNSNHTWVINGNSTSTFSTWQGWGYDINGFYSNPLFNNSAGSDYSLQSGSPAINAGTNVGLTTDIKGSPIPSSSPDIGAYQHVHSR